MIQIRTTIDKMLNFLFFSIWNNVNKNIMSLYGILVSNFALLVEPNDVIGSHLTDARCM